MNIEVIIAQTDPKLGERGKIIKVAPGYAHNYLIPFGKAFLATASNVKRFEAEKARFAKEGAQHLERAGELVSRIQQASITIEMEVGAGDKLYGSVTNQSIQEALQKQGISVGRKEIHLEEPIRKLGSYEIPINLYPDVSAKLKVSVVAIVGPGPKGRKRDRLV